jgi:hypothetical protein
VIWRRFEEAKEKKGKKEEWWLVGEEVLRKERERERERL